MKPTARLRRDFLADRLRPSSGDPEARAAPVAEKAKSGLAGSLEPLVERRKGLERALEETRRERRENTIVERLAGRLKDLERGPIATPAPTPGAVTVQLVGVRDTDGKDPERSPLQQVTVQLLASVAPAGEHHADLPGVIEQPWPEKSQRTWEAHKEKAGEQPTAGTTGQPSLPVLAEAASDTLGLATLDAKGLAGPFEVHVLGEDCSVVACQRRVFEPAEPPVVRFDLEEDEALAAAFRRSKVWTYGRDRARERKIQLEEQVHAALERQEQALVRALGQLDQTLSTLCPPGPTDIDGGQDGTETTGKERT